MPEGEAECGTDEKKCGFSRDKIATVAVLSQKTSPA
jgi:hypothetical protein